MSAYGFIETKGFVGCIEAANTMVKAANIEIVGKHEVGGGYVTMIIKGDVGAVKAAVESGVEAVKLIGNVVSAHVIARPHDKLLEVFFSEEE